MPRGDDHPKENGMPSPDGSNGGGEQDDRAILERDTAVNGTPASEDESKRGQPSTEPTEGADDAPLRPGSPRH